MSAIIKLCTCINKGQDTLHGKSMRVWNHAPSKGSKPKRYRCTVCGKEQEF